MSPVFPSFLQLAAVLQVNCLFLLFQGPPRRLWSLIATICSAYSSGMPIPFIAPLEGLSSLCLLHGDQGVLFGYFNSRNLKDLGAYISLYMWVEMHSNHSRRVHLKTNVAISKCEVTWLFKKYFVYCQPIWLCQVLVVTHGIF